MENYDPKQIEPKWQAKWLELGIYKPDLDKAEKPFYNLMMFPYPSAEGLHVGNMYAFVHSDTYGRFVRLKGFDVFEPIGLDGFGIHSENYAIKIKEHIKDVSRRTEKHFYEQLHMIGNQYDWSRTVETYKPDYYKWTQWLFLKMYEKGLAFRKKSLVNWCPSCKTVLSDEQVIADKCERCGTAVEKKEMEQWFWRITDYAERLLKNLDWIDWPEEIKTIQRNWIGKSEGVNFKEKVKDLNIELEVYDSIPQTFLAQTFTVIAPDHPLVSELVQGTEYEGPVWEFIEKIKQKKAAKRLDLEKDIEGIFTGRYVDNPFGTGDLPIWIASYVLADYGTGVVNCSAHDERDFAFAKKYSIPLKVVLLPADADRAMRVSQLEEFYREPNGIIQQPEEFKGIRWDESRKAIIDYIEKEDLEKDL